jgi:sortase A
MKDQNILDPHHGPPAHYRSDILWQGEQAQGFWIKVRTRLDKFPTGLLFIAIGILIYALGFGRLVSTALDEPSPIDQVAVQGDSDLGFIPYLVSDDPAQEELVAPTLPTVSNEGGPIPLTGVDPAENRAGEGLSDHLSNEAEGESDEGLAPLIWIPNRLVIPKISLDAPIEAVTQRSVELGGEIYEQWFAPDAPVVGWHRTSAQLGTAGNTVLNGHHNIFGEVFRDLSTLEVGDRISIHSGQRVFDYVVGTKVIVPERYQSVDTRLENARWIQPSTDERITLVTCWPYESNTHRVIVVAVPVGEG